MPYKLYHILINYLVTLTNYFLSVKHCNMHILVINFTLVVQLIGITNHLSIQSFSSNNMKPDPIFNLGALTVFARICRYNNLNK